MTPSALACATHWSYLGAAVAVPAEPIATVVSIAAATLAITALNVKFEVMSLSFGSVEQGC
jgi:hypothetical protein